MSLGHDQKQFFCGCEVTDDHTLIKDREDCEVELKNNSSHEHRKLNRFTCYPLAHFPWWASQFTSEDLPHCLWLSWTYAADSGNHASFQGIGPRLVAVSISFGGMLIFAMMLGLVSDAISEKFDSLRKGKSEVVEHNHTLILGWSDKLGSLLNQLAIANESLGGGTVVVMADRGYRSFFNFGCKLHHNP